MTRSSRLITGVDAPAAAGLTHCFRNDLRRSPIMAFTLAIGQPAPDFDLPGVDGKRYSLATFRGCRGLVVVFSCNHCPYVVGSEDRMIRYAMEYAPKGVAFIAINANETDNHPGDSFENMVRRAEEKKIPFHHLPHESQDGAPAYRPPRAPPQFPLRRGGGEEGGA